MEQNEQQTKPWQTGDARKRLHAALEYIQSNLNAPKDLYNKFGDYKYRSCESILKALKPLLSETDTTLVMGDQPVMIGDRFYIQASATFSNGEDEIITYAYAREDLAKKGMDGAQLTGATSSYARKYALNALFAIDDTADADKTNKHKTDKVSIESDAFAELFTATTVAQVKEVYNKYNALDPKICTKNGRFYKAVGARFEEINKMEGN